MIEFHLAALPPTTNDAYVPAKVRGHRAMLLSDAARAYKATTRLELLEKLSPADSMDGRRWHRLELTFYFEGLYTTTPGAKGRFRVVDVSNRVKLLEDVIAEVFGVNDCCFKTLVLSKEEGPEGVSVRIEELDG